MDADGQEVLKMTFTNVENQDSNTPKCLYETLDGNIVVHTKYFVRFQLSCARHRADTNEPFHDSLRAVLFSKQETQEGATNITIKVGLLISEDPHEVIFRNNYQKF